MDSVYARLNMLEGATMDTEASFCAWDALSAFGHMVQ